MKKLSSILVLIFCLIPFVASAWILRDEFNTALSAGSVNNTTSEPSGHTRTVIDTENKLSIADGKLTFSGGKALNDPGMKYPGITTQQGTVLLSCLSTFTSGITYIGLNNDNEIDKTIGITPNAGKWFSVEFGDDLPLTITSFPSCLAVTFSQLGHMWFGKDGESAYWKLGRVDKRTLLAATVYPVFGGHSLVGTFDFLRIPTTLWLPTPLASDGFGTAGVTDGLGHAEGVAGGIGSGGGGLAWQSGGTTWSVSGGKAVNTPTVGDTSLWDAGADTFESGTYGWIKYGNNTVENDNGKLKITYVDNKNGAYNALKALYSDLSQDLTIGQWYMFTADMMTAQAEQGDAVYISHSGTIMNVAWVTSNTMTPYNISFRALSTNGSVVYIGVMASGDVFYMDNISLKPLTLSELVNTVQTSTPDIIATVNIPTAITRGSWYGLALNVDSATDPQNMVIGLTNTYTATLTKMVNGVWTEVISGNITWVSNAELRVIKDGTTYRLYYNNALVGTATISDASIINNTRHGLFSTDAANTLDNFTLYARGTGNEYNILNQLMSTTVGGSLNLLGVGK